MTQQHPVSQADEGIRLDRWFKRHYPALPHAMLEKYLRKGAIRVDGKKAKSSDRVEAGQVILCPEIELATVTTPKPRPKLNDEIIAEARGWVIYKDDRVIVLNKPFGLPVQGGTKINKSVDGMLDALMFDKPERPRLVHRLDRDTSGVLVLARDAKTAAVLSKGFSGKSIEKTYWALVNNVPMPGRGTIDLPLSKYTHAETLREQVGVDETDGKSAITEYRVLESLARRFAFVEMKPLTGRMHQLRVHMASVGCPIVGDHKYGGSMNEAKALGVENVLHLHARRIVIPASGAGKAIDVSAPLPAHMRASFEALGLDIPKK